MIVPTGQIVTTALAGLCLLSWWVTGTRPAWLRFASSAILLAALTGAVIYTIGSPLQPKFANDMGSDRLWQQVVISIWWVLSARLAVEISRASVLIKSFSGEGRLFSDLLAGLVYLAAVLTIIKTVFGFPIGGLVATSGIIAIVLGLALQNTLADVFAGIAVGIERPYAIGDLVWFEGPIEGEVVQINWRSVQIKTFGNDIATIPNSLVAKSRFINRSIPSMRRSDSVQVPCLRTHSPERVCELIQQAILLCPNVLEKPAATVALVRIGRRQNHYEISFSVANSSLLWQTKSMLLKEVLRQMRSDGDAGHRHPVARSDTAEPPATRILDIALFDHLPLKTRDELECQLVRKQMEIGDVLFTQGDCDASLFIIKSGVLEVTRGDKHNTTVLGRIGPGDYIGEIGMLTGAGHAATVAALTRAVVYQLRKELVAPLITADPDLLHAFEVSAKRGQALIDRSVAASVGTATMPSSQLLDRMRAFFHLGGT